MINLIRNLDNFCLQFLRNGGKFNEQLTKKEQEEIKQQDILTEELIEQETEGFVI